MRRAASLTHEYGRQARLRGETAAGVAAAAVAGRLAGASLLALGLLLAGPVRAQDRSNLLDNAHNGGSGTLEESSDEGTGSALAATSNESDATDFLGGILSAIITTVSSVGIGANTDTGNPDERSNAVTDSFNDYDGTPVVQQNTGDTSALAAASERFTNATNVGAVDQDATATATVDGNNVSITDDLTGRSNLINPSFNDASGAALVQQNNGNGAALSASDSVVEVPGDTGDVEQTATATAEVEDVTASQGTGSRDNTIDGSFHGYTGEAKVQQNNGDGSALSVAHAVTRLGGSAGSVSQSASASGSASGNTSSDAGASRSNSIDGSFGEADGVFTVQQNNANGSTLSAASAVVTGGGDGDGTEQSSEVDSESSGNSASASGGTRQNSLTDSFGGAGFVATVQQNNGDGAALGAATSVVIDDEDSLGPPASVAALRSSVSGNSSHHIGSGGGGGYSNSITGAFNQSRFIAVTAQQNNGANSVLGSSISIRTGPGAE